MSAGRDIDLTIIAKGLFRKQYRLLARSKRVRRRILTQALDSDSQPHIFEWLDSSQSLTLSVPAEYHRISNHSFRLATQAGEPTTVVCAYERSGGALLILGGAGSGKTFAGQQLMRHLANNAQGDPLEPAPLLLSVMSWQPHDQDLQSWLERAALEQCGIDREVLGQWLSQNEVALILDGLDELSRREYRNCVAAINKFRNLHKLTPLVVMCRSQDYIENRAEMSVTGVLSLRRIPSQEVLRIIGYAGEEFSSLHTAAEADHRLRELIGAPLFLLLSMYSYQNTTLPEITSGSSWEQSIIDRYVARASRRAQVVHNRGDLGLSSWLPKLAAKMKRSHSAVMYPDRFPLTIATNRTITQITRRAGIYSCLVLLLGIALPRVSILFFSDGSTAQFYAISGLVVAAISTQFAWRTTKKVIHSPPGGRRVLVRKKLGHVLKRWVAAYILLTFATMAISSLSNPVLVVIFYFVLTTVCAYPGIGLIQDSSKTDVSDAPHYPGQELRSLLVSAITCGVVTLGTIFTTLLFALIPISASGVLPADPVSITLYFAVPYAILAGFTNGGCELLVRRAAIHHGIKDGLLPKPYLASFVALRRSSIMVPMHGGYSFVHSLVRDHIAKGARPSHLSVSDRAVVADGD